MALLAPSAFDDIFARFSGRQVGFVELDGNVGDRLIEKAARQLMDEFGVVHRTIQAHELDGGVPYRPLDHVLVSGGGNMGGLYPIPRAQRDKALALGVPVTVLPQSFTDSDEALERYERVYVRERASLDRMPGTLLAPDLALGLRPPWVDEGVEAGTGIWLRADIESVFPDRSVSLGDAVDVSASVDDYLGLASKFEHIVTDRLHFAIAGLLVGRRVTLLPNAYAKNRSMYETWLRGLGCRWRSHVRGIAQDRDAIRERLWRRISAAPSRMLPWNRAPSISSGWELTHGAEGAALLGAAGTMIRLNPLGVVLASLCDGEWTVEDMCLSLSAQYRRPVVEVARDVQQLLGALHARGVLDPEPASSTATGAPGVVRRRPRIDVEILAPRRERGRLRWSARVSGTTRGDFLHYFECHPRWRGALTRRADPFVLALLPRAMRDGANLRVSGARVDSRLLDNLDEYQRVWSAWRPDRWSVIEIEAQEVAPRPGVGRPAVSVFSGGVDSTHTVHRHRVEPDGRRNRELGAVVMARGFDIPVTDVAGFGRAVERLRPLLDEAGVDLIEVHSNLRVHMTDWEMEHGAALAAVLSLFSGRFGSGIVPSTAPYRLMFPWGSNPLTDPMLGGAFGISYDSAALSRLDKLRALARWPTAVSRLRVCWRGGDPSRNCGRCGKCLLLALGLRVLRAPMDCFDAPPSSEELTAFVRRASLYGLARLEFSDILAEAEQSRIHEPWVAPLADRLERRRAPSDESRRNENSDTRERSRSYIDEQPGQESGYPVE